MRVARRITIWPSGFPAAIRRHGRNLRNIYIPIHAGGHSGPPLRRGFVSMRGNQRAEPKISQSFRNARRHRHERNASTTRCVDTIPMSQTSSMSKHYVFLCGRAQRPSPTRWICFNERQQRSRTGPHNRRFVTAVGIGTHRMHPPRELANPSQRARHHQNVQALCFPVRADTAVRPYAEDLSQ